MHLRRPLKLLPALVVAALVGTLAPLATSANAAPTCADLQVDNFTVSPSSPIAGQPAEVDVQITNAGTCDAFGFVVQWKITPSATSGPSAPVTSLAAGDTTIIPLTYTFPTAGNFESIAIVDSHNDVPETNEDNNLQILPVTVQKATTDLSITSISTDPTPPVQGRSETTTIVVQNSGNTAAGPFQLKWVPKAFASPLVQQIDSLAAGTSQPYTFDYTYQQAGKVTGTATVDSTKTVTETNENNNTATLAITVDPPLADLAISGVDINPTSPVPGDTVTATVHVTNIGHIPAGPFMVSWKPTPTATPVTKQVSGLVSSDDQGSNVTDVDLKYVFPQSGSFAGVVTVDSTKVIKEVNENNNTQATQVTLAPNGVDLTIDSVTVEPEQNNNLQALAASGHAVQGASALVTIHVTNNGNTASGPFLVDWNPDSTYVFSPSLSTVTQQVNALGAFSSTDVTFEYAYPKFGNVSTLATVDPRNSVAETNEANNQKLLPVTVDPAPIDLQITNFVINPAQPVRGIPASADITVQNVGPFPTNTFTVQWNLTGKDAFPKGSTVQGGLNANETRTVHITGTYAVKGDYVSKAIVDAFNQVTEPGVGESNNTKTLSVTVVPQSAKVNISLDKIHAYTTMEFSSCLSNPYDCGDGEWDDIVLFVYDPNATCTISLTTGDAPGNKDLKLNNVKGVSCQNDGDYHDVNPGDDLGIGKSHEQTLLEQTPLAAAVGILEIDGLVPDVPGYATFLAFRDDYLHMNGQQPLVPGKSCATVSGFPNIGQITPRNGGHCFDAYFSVTHSDVVGQQSVMAHSTLANATNATNATASAPTAAEKAAGAKEQATLAAVWAKVKAQAVALAKAKGTNMGQVKITAKTTYAK